MKKVSRSLKSEENDEYGGFTCAVVCVTACYAIPPFIASVASQISAF